MKRLAYRTVNVFSIASDPFSGNPLCVFEDGTGLDDRTMQALARQTNLSETTFILPATRSDATARVRIFTPSLEMPFAGHPTLGTAYVVRALRGGDEQRLEMRAGVVAVRVELVGPPDPWTLEAAHAPVTRVPDASARDLARMVGASELAGPPLWVNTGVEQLVLPLATADDVRRARPDVALLEKLAARTGGDKSSAYVWARDGDRQAVARYFFVQGGGVLEDPATGSACANLGGWMVATGEAEKGRLSLTVSQGEAVGRPSRLGLRVKDGRVFVTGGVTEVGEGFMQLEGG